MPSSNPPEPILKEIQGKFTKGEFDKWLRKLNKRKTNTPATAKTTKKATTPRLQKTTIYRKLQNSNKTTNYHGTRKLQENYKKLQLLKLRKKLQKIRKIKENHRKS